MQCKNQLMTEYTHRGAATGAGARSACRDERARTVSVCPSVCLVSRVCAWRQATQVTAPPLSHKMAPSPHATPALLIFPNTLLALSPLMVGWRPKWKGRGGERRVLCENTFLENPRLTVLIGFENRCSFSFIKQVGHKSWFKS